MGSKGEEGKFREVTEDRRTRRLIGKKKKENV